MSTKKVTLTTKRYDALLLVKSGRIDFGFYHGKQYWALNREESFSDRVPTAALNWLFRAGYITVPDLVGDRGTAMLTTRGYYFLAEAR